MLDRGVFTRKVLPFLTHLVSGFNVRLDRTHVAMVQEVHHAVLRWNLEDYTDVSELQRQIMQLPYATGRTKLDNLIDFTDQRVFSGSFTYNRLTPLKEEEAWSW